MRISATLSLPGHTALAMALVCVLVGCSETDEEALSVQVTYTETREPCLDRDPLRNLYFGDLHFHTTHSWDAYGYHLAVTPAESYRFARGSAVLLPPADASGKGTRSVRLGRPLDFAAATDHAEYLGEVHLCITSGSAAYSSASCQDFRKQGTSSVTAWGMKLINPDGDKRMADICGSDGKACKEAARKVWSSLQKAAEDAYDRSETCAFVTFPGYEYTASPLVTNQHRNVIFRNSQVLDLPLTYYEKPTAWGLWSELKSRCLDSIKGCDVMVIPHNTNWSNGTMFFPDDEGAAAVGGARAGAELRAALEPVLETFQHKGDMECTGGLSGITAASDPLCSFEKLRTPPITDCGNQTGWGGIKDVGCVSQLDFFRGILLEGMAEQIRLGINPYRLGILGSTDTHNGTPGNTWEQGWPGNVGSSDDTAEERLGDGNMTHRGRVNNPGGLAAVWAYEKSRDAIFEALRRREVYSTSGTRIRVRFFGAWDLSADLCQQTEETLAEAGYRRGVAMGGVLPSRPSGTGAPVLAVRAEYDPGPPGKAGTLLQRVQIVKGWITAAGQRHLAVYTVAGQDRTAATVDTATCKTSGPGEKTLCAVWTDPAFDPASRTYYYARVLENPTCRWSTRECNALAANKRPAGCSDTNVSKTIQERAWTSAIWFDP